MNCSKCKYITLEREYRYKSKTPKAMVCRNRRSELFGSILNITPNGDYVDYINKICCEYGEAEEN